MTRSFTRALLLMAVAAIAAVAQPASLVGQWQSTQDDSSGQVTIKLNLATDGSLEMQLQGVVSAAELQSDGGPDLFPQGMTILATGTGTWGVDGDSLRLVFDTVETSFNGMAIDQFLTSMIDRLVQELVVSSNIPPDQVPLFEQMVREQLNAEFSSGDFQQQLSQGMTDTLQGQHHMAWSLTDGVLTMIDDTGEATQWQRGEAGSAVEATGWGQLKAALR